MQRLSKTEVNKGLPAYLKILKEWHGIPLLAFLKFFFVLFISIIAVTTIDTELISMGQLFYSANFIKRQINTNYYKLLILYISPLTLLLSFHVEDNNFGAWGTFWIIQFIIIMPAMLNALLNIINVNTKFIYSTFLFSLISSFSIFFYTIYDSEYIRNYPCRDIFILFFVPSFTVIFLSLHKKYKLLKNKHLNWVAYFLIYGSIIFSLFYFSGGTESPLSDRAILYIKSIVTI